MTRNGRTKVIYKGTFISKQTLLFLSQTEEDIKEIIDEMKEDKICAVECANESDVCVKTKEEANRNSKSGFFINFSIKCLNIYFFSIRKTKLTV